MGQNKTLLLCQSAHEADGETSYRPGKRLTNHTLGKGFVHRTREELSDSLVNNQTIQVENG